MLVAGYNCEQETRPSCCRGADTGGQKRQAARKYVVTKCKKNNEGNQEAAEIENNGESGKEPLPMGQSGKETSSFPVAEAVNYALFPLPSTPFLPLTRQLSQFRLLLWIHVGAWSGHVMQI